jgi:hypothetical protein
MAAQDLFDTLSGAFGHGVDRPALNAFVANSQATNGLRSAQTTEALNNAQQQQEEQQARSTLESTIAGVLGDDGKPLVSPSAARFVAQEQIAKMGSAQQVMAALREAQQAHNTGIASDPSKLGTPAATAAIQGNTNKLAEPIAAPASGEYSLPAGLPQPNFQETPQGAAKLTDIQAQAGQRGALAQKALLQPEGSTLSDDAAYNGAVKYNSFGQLPSLGMGASAAADRKKMLNFAAMLSHDPNWHPPSWDAQGAAPPAGATPAAPGATPALAGGQPVIAPTGHPTLQNAQDTAANPADAKAQTSTLTDMTKRTSLADAAEQTALKNLQIARETLASADQTGSPLANTIQNKVRQGLFGDPQVSAYQNAISTARNEYARVISMATGATGITDYAMKEGQKLFPDDLAPAQFESNFSVAQREMANRTASMHDQIANAKNTLHGGSAPVAPSSGAPSGTVMSLDDYLKTQGH